VSNPKAQFNGANRPRDLDFRYAEYRKHRKRVTAAWLAMCLSNRWALLTEQGQNP